MGIDGVFDMHHVDFVAAVAHEPEPTAAGTLQDAGHEMRIAYPPDQVWPQREGAERLGVRLEHLTLGDRLRERIWTRAILGQRQGLVGASKVASAVDHAGC